MLKIRKKIFWQKVTVLAAGIAVLVALLEAVAAFQKVEFADPGLEAAVREKLGNPQRPIARTDLLQIKELNASGRKICHLKGVENMRQLVVLNLAHNWVEDLGPLQTLYKLRELNLVNNRIPSLKNVNFAALSGLRLRSLDLTWNGIRDRKAGILMLSDISLLSQLTSLETLALGYNQIEDLRPLSALVNLQTLDLRGNRLTDISPLASMTDLKELNLGDNDVVDLTPLSGLTNLTYLNIHSNPKIRSLLPLEPLTGLTSLIMRNVPTGEDINILGRLTRLKRLDLRNCSVRDIAPLNNLRNLQRLDLRGNSIIDISPLSALAVLEELNLRDNGVADLTPLSGLANLTYLNIHSNPQIRSILPLKSLSGLKTLIMRNIPAGDDIIALDRMSRLERLNVRNCGIAETSVLGNLMTAGALQDNPAAGITAAVNIAENSLPEEDWDPYLPIRQYWPKVADRVPIVLPRPVSLIEPPSFSHPGGFYDGPFALELSSGESGARIYYTLDNSLPTDQSIIYAAPLQIQNSAEDIGSGCLVAVVRAKVIAENGESSEVVTRTYFVHPLGVDLYSLPVISLVTDNANLFDQDTGIYQNPLQRGLSWERPVAIEFFEPDGTTGFSLNAGIRIHGGSSRTLQQKSLRIYVRPEYDREGTLQYNLFPGLARAGSGQPLDEFRTLILHNSGNDWHRTILRDVLMQGLVSQSRHLHTQVSRPVVVFINGRYWGLYHLRERYDEDYLALNYHVFPGDIAILERNAELKRGKPADRENYLNLRDYAKTHDLASSEHYRHLAGLMDMRNYIEYYAANIYFHNTDWPHNNIIFWRIRPGDGKYDIGAGRDGRWRWMLQGTDYGFGLKRPAAWAHNLQFLEEFEENYGSLSGPEADTLKWVTLPLNGRLLEEWPNSLFRSLLMNEEFRNGFINHLADQLNSSFHPDWVQERIDELQAVLEPEMADQCRRWRRMSVDDWRKNVEVLRYFAARRPEHLRQHVIDCFGLSGLAKLSLQTDPARGRIRVNDLEISATAPGVRDPASWTGVYFRDIPIRITAIPEPGYSFAGWEGADEEEAEMELVLGKDISLTARFEREKEWSSHKENHSE